MACLYEVAHFCHHLDHPERKVKNPGRENLLHKVLCHCRHSEMSLRSPPCKPQPWAGRDSLPRDQLRGDNPQAPAGPFALQFWGRLSRRRCLRRQVVASGLPFALSPRPRLGGRLAGLKAVGITSAALSFPKTGLCRCREKRAEERAEPHLVTWPRRRKSPHRQVGVAPVERESVPACRVLRDRPRGDPPGLRSGLRAGRLETVPPALRQRVAQCRGDRRADPIRISPDGTRGRAAAQRAPRSPCGADGRGEPAGTAGASHPPTRLSQLLPRCAHHGLTAPGRGLRGALRCRGFWSRLRPGLGQPRRPACESQRPASPLLPPWPAQQSGVERKVAMQGRERKFRYSGTPTPASTLGGAWCPNSFKRKPLPRHGRAGDAMRLWGPGSRISRAQHAGGAWR